MTQPNGIKLPPPSEPKQFRIQVFFEIDTKFITLIPSVNINRYLGGIEIMWLVFGLYIEKTTTQP